MIESFPRLQQPLGSNSCLPTAIRAVLIWYGVEDSELLDSISEICGESELGCDFDTALAGLRVEFEIVDLSQSEEEIRALVSGTGDPQPVIVNLRNQSEIGPPYHAVVLIAIEYEGEDPKSNEIVTFLDPITGQLDKANSFFWVAWSRADFRAFTVQP